MIQRVYCLLFGHRITRQDSWIGVIQRSAIPQPSMRMNLYYCERCRGVYVRAVTRSVDDSVVMSGNLTVERLNAWDWKLNA